MALGFAETQFQAFPTLSKFVHQFVCLRVQLLVTLALGKCTF